MLLKIKHFWFFQLSFIGILSLSTLGFSKTIIRLGTLAPQGSSWYLTLKQMGQKWAQAPDGGVRLIVYPSGILGDESDMIQKMRIGQIQACLLTVAGLSSIDRSAFVLATPMMYRSYSELNFVLNHMKPYLKKRFLKKGFVILNWGNAGWIRFFGKKPIATPADLKKMNFFIWAGDNRALSLWQSAGFHPVPLAATDIMPGLQTGLINSFDTTPLTALSFQWFALAHYMTDLKFAPLVGATIMTLKAWDSIPPEDRPAILHAAHQAGIQFINSIKKEDHEAIHVMKKKGLKVVHLTAAQKSSWESLFLKAYPKMIGQLFPVQAFQKAIIYRTQYRKLHPTPIN